MQSTYKRGERSRKQVSLTQCVIVAIIVLKNCVKLLVTKIRNKTGFYFSLN